MKLAITIPNEIARDFRFDNFADFFGRVRADTERNGILCGNYEIEILDALEKAFANATEINN